MRLRPLTAVVLAAAAASAVVAPAHAAPSTSTSAPSSSAPTSSRVPDTDMVVPSLPMPVPQGSFGYIATRGVTEWMAARDPAAIIAGLPVPPAYKNANSSMARIVGLELDAAMSTPGACVQVIVGGPEHPGQLFNYGFFAIDPEYCPS